MIAELFVREILENAYGAEAESVYDHSPLLQYLDKKMGAVHGDSKTRRNLANIYAVYSILHFYVDDFFDAPQKYRKFEGYKYMRLFNYFRSLYGGSKLQNHALNSRVNGEFNEEFSRGGNDLIIKDAGRYLLHIDYLYVNGQDVSKVACAIVEKYIELLELKDHHLLTSLENIKRLTNYDEKKKHIKLLLTDEAEARVFEIISYAILKNYYNGQCVYFGYTRDTIKEEKLKLYKTGRTNANDGGIDFVMRPVGRFFQVTEVDNYDKYLLDIDKVMHFPVTFVIKTNKSKDEILADLHAYVQRRANGMEIIEKRYQAAIEDVITINEIKNWTSRLQNDEVDGIIRDIDLTGWLIDGPCRL